MQIIQYMSLGKKKQKEIQCKLWSLQTFWDDSDTVWQAIFKGLSKDRGLQTVVIQQCLTNSEERFGKNVLCLLEKEVIFCLENFQGAQSLAKQLAKQQKRGRSMYPLSPKAHRSCVCIRGQDLVCAFKYMYLSM